ncbi:hypothetical protein EDF46_3603 [Frondihabitans sp. PhB188]|uniref:hypothetical protein n=1 Tax=Frondihabitans sp. PhB188 TaxID=2485200 RepID=UPI000FBA233E|nr:hypothetical protein [Frondihabitans sp. PhB188]ROQ30287.1 hypothetical protein EDF46_3603 [Frondihabitans sp. PhB188]
MDQNPTGVPHQEPTATATPRPQPDTGNSALGALGLEQHLATLVTILGGHIFGATGWQQTLTSWSENPHIRFEEIEANLLQLLACDN